jgi:hypothetical protein
MRIISSAPRASVVRPGHVLVPVDDRPGGRARRSGSARPARPLDATYGARYGCPPCSDMVMMLTIVPGAPRWTMSATAACMRKNGPRRLIATCSSNTSGVPVPPLTSKTRSGHSSWLDHDQPGAHRARSRTPQIPIRNPVYQPAARRLRADETDGCPAPQEGDAGTSMRWRAGPGGRRPAEGPAELPGKSLKRRYGDINAHC